MVHILMKKEGLDTTGEVGTGEALGPGKIRKVVTLLQDIPEKSSFCSDSNIFGHGHF